MTSRHSEIKIKTKIDVAKFIIPLQIRTPNFLHPEIRTLKKFDGEEL